MKLTNYLYGAYAGLYSNGFPGELELPQELAGRLAQLYQFGEANGCEYGCRVVMNPDPTADSRVRLDLPDLVHGTANGCQIPQTNFPGDCGDMHSHPSASIGHVDGYSAHSLQDYLVFQHHLNKPVFIRFVGSGPWFYAVVYRQGLTHFRPNDITQLVAEDQNAMWDEFARKNKTTYEQVQQKLFDEQLHHGKDPIQQLIEWKRQTPGFGKWLMETSIENNTDLAAQDGYGFYSAKSSGTLRLQAGPRG